MLRRVRILILFTLFCSGVYAQCLTVNDKIIPEPHLSLNNSFGWSVSIHQDYIAVGDPSNDTLSVNGGAVFIYKREAGAWKKIATLLPSDPEEYGQFGKSLTLTENYLFVGSPVKPHVYVFAKSGTWENSKENHKIVSPEASEHFGEVIKTHQGGDKLIISDTRSREGIVYFYAQPASGWESTSSAYLQLEPPVDINNFQSQNFGQAIDIQDDLLTIGAPAYDYSVGCVYLYKDLSGSNWSNIQLQARLSSSHPEGSSPDFGKSLKIIKGNVFVQASSFFQHTIFQFKSRNDWQDAKADTVYYPTDSLGREKVSPLMGHDSTLVVIGTSTDSLKAYSFKLTPQNTLEKQSAKSLYQQARVNYLPITLDADTDGTLCFGVINDPTTSSKLGTFWTVPKDNNRWKFEESIITPFTYVSAAEDYFGIEFLKIDDYLLVGSPNDKRTFYSSGSVQFFKRKANGWERFHEIVADSGEYSFGKSIQFQNDTLFISNSSSINIYSKGADWDDWKLVQKMYPPDSLFTHIHGFGTHIVKNGSVLAALATTQSPTHSLYNTLFIFEKGPVGWVHKQYLVLELASKSQNILHSPLDIYDQTILVVDRGALIIEKDATGNWQSTATLKSSDWKLTDGFAHSVILTKDLAFIGTPYDDERGKRNNGCVFVFKRNGPNWQDSYEHSVIHPIEAKTDQQFGISLALFNNKLAVGALMDKYLNTLAGPMEDPNADYEAASVYLFEAADDSWSQYKELGQVKGDLNNPGNLYGSAIHLDEGGLLAGAPYDHHINGVRGGAIYHAPIIDFPSIAVDYDSLSFCLIDTTIVLGAAMKGGTWTGPGVDENSGTFNPQIAKSGIHELVYQGLSCTYRKHIYVEVSPSLNTSYKHENDLRLCENAILSLEVDPVKQASYQWYYLGEGIISPQSLEEDTASIKVNKSGKYWVEVSNSNCSLTLDTITVNTLSAPIVQLPAQQYACNPSPRLSIENFNPDYTYRLYWQNSYGDFLQFQEIDQAEYEVKLSGTYQLVSSFGSCQWTSETFTILEEIEDFNITTEAANTESCYQDQWLKATQGEQYHYSWKYYPEEGKLATTIGSTYKVLADKTGYYEVTIYYAQCSWTSDQQYFIRKEIDGLSVSPEATEIEVCAHELWLEAPLQEGFTYTWNYYNEAGAIPIVVGNENKLIIGETGYYELNISYGQCDWKSEKKYVKIHEPTIIEEMGNVITPNGDGVNDTFGIPLNNTIKYELSIFNRLGKLVFQTQDPNDRWGGKSCAAGVYVWNLSYQNICDPSPTLRKGMVSIVRRKN